MSAPNETPSFASYDELVAALRAATPRPEDLAPVRRRLVAREALGAWPKLVLIALALANVMPAARAPIERALPAPPTSIIAASGVHERSVGPVPDTVTAVPAPAPVPAPVTISVSGVHVPARAHAPRASLDSAVLLAFDTHKQARAPLPGVPAAPGGGPPSEILAEALRAQSQGRHADACLGLQRVVEGATDDSPDQLARAQLGLGRCLYDLGLHHAAAGVFVEIAQRGAGHPSFDATLPWLARLATRVPEPSELIDAIGRYDAERARSLAVPAGERDHLLYLLGRARYEQGQLPDAISLLSQVAPGSRWSLPAKLTEGAAHVRARRAGPAARAFRGVIEEIRAGRTGGAEDPARLRDLAWISLARLYYSAALQDRDERRAADLLSRAYDAWGHITEGSEHFHDAFFEETWALYMARQPERALGHVHGITSPYFESSRYPEAIVVRAMIHYEHCQWSAVEAALHEFHDRYDPLLAELERTAARFPDHEAAFGLLVSLHERRAHVPPSVQPSLRSALGDREILRYAAQVRSIDRERARLESLRGGSGAPITGSELHDRVAADLSIARAMAIDRAGEQAQDRLTRLIDELRERQTQMDTVELELATARREELARPNPSPMGDANGGRIVAVQGDQTWPFDGEYWPDEVPYYRQVVVDRCIR